MKLAHVLTLVLSAGFLAAGCARPQPPAPAPSGSPAASVPGGAAPATDAAADSDEDREIREALAKLPEADRAAAEEQKTCPVSDARLGSMGQPLKVTVKGRDVFLCCEGCQPDFEKNPDEYLAKLDAASEPAPKD